MSNPSGIEVVVKNTPFKKRIQSHLYINTDYIDLIPFFSESQRIFVHHTKIILNDLLNMKVYTILEAKFIRPRNEIHDDSEIRDVNERTEQVTTFYFQSKLNEIQVTTQLSSWFKTNVIDVMMTKVDELQESGSGWTLHEITSLNVNYNKFVRFRGSSYLELPPEIKSKRAVINIKNYDHHCFMWAILSAIHPAKKDATGLSNYERFKHELNFEGIKFPVKLNDITIFEELNPEISVNVYITQREYSIFTERNEDIIVPVRLTKKVKKNHIHLLMVFESEEEEECNVSDDEICPPNILDIIENSTNTHYMWIKNLSALIQKQVVKKNRSKKYICDRCLQYFYTNEKMTNHFKQCELMNETKVTLPDETNRWLSFVNFKHKIEVPFIIYADIESLLVSNEADMRSNKIPKGAIQRHIANSVGYYFHSRIDPNLSHYESFSGVDCIDRFISKIEYLMEHVVWPKIHEIKPMDLTAEEEKNFKCACVCHICKKRFNNHIKKYTKVRDHCHSSGKFRGAAHSMCNLKFQISKSVPVVFHNLDYDSHFLIEKLANAFPGSLKIIPKNSEHYISFTKHLPN